MCIGKYVIFLSRQKSRYGAKLEHSDAKLVSGSSEVGCVRVVRVTVSVCLCVTMSFVRVTV